MNRRFFISVLLSSPLAYAGKKKKNNDKNEDKSAYKLLTGTIVLKNKEHENDRDEYLLLSDSKAYSFSRALYSKLEGKVDSNVKITCKVLNSDRIIAIKGKL